MTPAYMQSGSLSGPFKPFIGSSGGCPAVDGLPTSAQRYRRLVSLVPCGCASRFAGAVHCLTVCGKVFKNSNRTGTSCGTREGEQVLQGVAVTPLLPWGQDSSMTATDWRKSAIRVCLKYILDNYDT